MCLRMGSGYFFVRAALKRYWIAGSCSMLASLSVGGWRVSQELQTLLRRARKRSFSRTEQTPLASYCMALVVQCLTLLVEAVERKFSRKLNRSKVEDVHREPAATRYFKTQTLRALKPRHAPWSFSPGDSGGAKKGVKGKESEWRKHSLWP